MQRKKKLAIQELEVHFKNLLETFFFQPNVFFLLRFFVKRRNFKTNVTSSW